MTADASTLDDRPIGPLEVFLKAKESADYHTALQAIDRYSETHLEDYVAKASISNFLPHLNTECKSLFQNLGFDSRIHSIQDKTSYLDFYWKLPPRNLVFYLREKNFGFEVYFKTNTKTIQLCPILVDPKDVAGSLSRCFSFVIFLCGELSQRRAFGLGPSSFQDIRQKFLSQTQLERRF